MFGAAASFCAGESARKQSAGPGLPPGGSQNIGSTSRE